MPREIYDLTSVQLDNGFLAFGGTSGGNPVHNVYSIDNNYIWFDFKNGLQEEKFSPIGVNVPNSFFGC